jgi:hypothetical protein
VFLTINGVVTVVVVYYVPIQTALSVMKKALLPIPRLSTGTMRKIRRVLERYLKIVLKRLFLSVDTVYMASRV